MTVTDTAAPNTAVAPRAFRVGDKVTVTGYRFPGIWTVVKVNPVNLKLVNDETKGRLNASPSYLRHLSADGTPAPARPYVETVSYVPDLAAGTIVRLNRPFRQHTTSNLYVVTGGGTKRLSLSRLGGGEGLRSPQSMVTVVDPASLGLTA